MRSGWASRCYERVRETIAEGSGAGYGPTPCCSSTLRGRGAHPSNFPHSAFGKTMMCHDKVSRMELLPLQPAKGTRPATGLRTRAHFIVEFCERHNESIASSCQKFC